ncbi:MAG: hypothetical protein SH817_06045 [Leptospira sp.]|nr:hypothetical protein [Leptospira sp.]
MRKTCLQIDIEPSWSAIANIRDTLGDLSASLSKATKDFVQITATELLENAMKYRSEKNKNENIELEFNLDHENIEIKVSNKFDNDDDLLRLISTVKKIKNESDPKSLYEARLKEIYDNDQDKHNRLGLFRIIHECGFDLNCEQNETEITVIAKKHLGK